MEPQAQMVLVLVGLGFNFVALLLTTGGILFALFRFFAVALERLARVETKQDAGSIRFEAIEQRQARTEGMMQDLMQSQHITPRRQTSGS